MGLQNRRMWSDVVAANSNSKISEVVIFADTSNPNYTINNDTVTVNNDVYDFQNVQIDPTPTAISKEQCKNNGWKNFYTADNKPFKNQGACVSYVQANEHASFKRD